MESKSTSLLQIINVQKEEIDKYKKKLRDVVTAFRALQSEKDALQESLNALRDGDPTLPTASNASKESKNETEDSKQVTALVNSLATLSAGKAQMEASFQADNKKAREEKEKAESKCKELNQQLSKFQLEIEECKSKLIVERHERDKERADHGAIMIELQNVLASERSARMGLEEAMANLRKQKSDTGGISVERYERKIMQLQKELETTGRKLELVENKGKEPPRELSKLQGEIRNLQLEHQTAIQQERKRAEQVEERAKRHALLQEERVINLETKLADLSAIVGTYDRLRQEDQNEILKLKERIAAGVKNKEPLISSEDVAAESNEIRGVLVEKAAQESSTQKNEIDHDSHASCLEELLKVSREFEAYKKETMSKANADRSGKDLDEIVKTLQDRIRLLTDESELQERQHKNEVEKLKMQLRTEKSRFKETLTAAELDFRGRQNLLETQLQRLRERSLALLEDKEQELHSLQGTFQAFLPGTRHEEQAELPTLTSMRDGPRMLHYANELARRDVDLASLRRAKHKLEATLRDLQRAVVADAEKHREERQSLREEIARLERCQTREGANLEYLKNVVLSFLISNDPCSKRHMCNAIAAVLKFSERELEKVSRQAHNSWWTSGKS